MLQVVFTKPCLVRGIVKKASLEVGTMAGQSVDITGCLAVQLVAISVLLYICDAISLRRAPCGCVEEQSMTKES